VDGWEEDSVGLCDWWEECEKEKQSAWEDWWDVEKRECSPWPFAGQNYLRRVGVSGRGRGKRMVEEKKRGMGKKKDVRWIEKER
jgi:hypothetical protein